MDNTLTECNVTSLSLIIPIYNVEQYLEECLDSVSQQNRDDLEVILVDDGSSDRSKSIAVKYTLNRRNWYLLSHQKNSGLAAARNTALDFAKGRYIMMLDSDDWLAQAAIDIVLSEIVNQKTPNVDVIQFGCNKVYHSEMDQTTRIAKDLYCSNFSPDRPLIEHQKKILSLPNYACLKIVRREYIETSKLRFQNIYYEDVPWSISLALGAESIRIIPKAIINYRQRADSITYTKSAKHLDLLGAYNSMFKAVSHDSNKKPLKQSLSDAFLTSSYYLCRHRARRLDNRHIISFRVQYRKMITDQNIFPSTLRTLVMMLITVWQLWLLA